MSIHYPEAGRGATIIPFRRPLPAPPPGRDKETLTERANRLFGPPCVIPPSDSPEAA